MKKIILLIETSRAFGRQLIIGIARYSRIRGPWSFYKEPIDLKSSVPKLTNWKPDGIIMRDSLISKELLKLNVPTILAIHDSKYPEYLPVIKTDSETIGRLASEHLVSKGFKHFAYCGFDNYDWSKGRGIWFKYFNEKAGFCTYIYEQKESIMKDWNKEQLYLSDWIQKLPKPVAIFACNDDRGQHILEVCKMLDLKVPRDVAVLGVDNDPMVCEISDPPLSSLALNVEVAGFEAAKLLDQMMNKQISSKEVYGKQILVTPSHVVQRQSTDILAVDDNEVAKALHFIRENAKKKIFVDDVVRATNLSRRALEIRFREILHRSIYDVIREVRIEFLSQLLIDTDLPIGEIASLFEFTDLEHVSRYFKKQKGMSLRQFRKIHHMR